MKQNIGEMERTIRIMGSILIFAAGGYFHSYWGAVGLIPLLTGMIGWCPLYLAKSR